MLDQEPGIRVCDSCGATEAKEDLGHSDLSFDLLCQECIMELVEEAEEQESLHSWAEWACL
jgi:hypothetical protein